MECILENINRERYQVPENWPYHEVHHLFKEPLVSVDDQKPDFTWTGPDAKGLIKFLVEENGFSDHRVTKAIQKIEAAQKKSLTKQVVSTSVLKRLDNYFEW